MTAGLSEVDIRLMAEAIALAAAGLGTTAPNPSVGAVIVRDGAVLASGRTQPGGRPHAETEALRQAGDAARGATLYVSLEPCSHHGRTPPCAEAIIAAGVARVVIGCPDPDPRVAGRGVAMLRAAGIEVAEGLCLEAARWVALGHIRRVTLGRPFVQVKVAVDADGQVPLAVGGRPVFVTGAAARDEVHRLRAEADAILTGIGTVLADDPELTCRLPGLEDRSPVRVVLDTDARLPAECRLARTARRVPVWLLHGGDPTFEGFPDVRAMAVPIDAASGRVDVAAALRRLAEAGITRVLVEAGPTLSGAVLAAGLADEVVVIRSRSRLSATTPSAVALPPLGLAALNDPARWRCHRQADIGEDILTSYRAVES
jgi:diaminohydroxyphosphoribosylaminopyrimidine deaminase/5-amino-6-(5-phosphoribosylamino)uracil reductase